MAAQQGCSTLGACVHSPFRVWKWDPSKEADMRAAWNPKDTKSQGSEPGDRVNNEDCWEAGKHRVWLLCLWSQTSWNSTPALDLVAVQFLCCLLIYEMDIVKGFFWDLPWKLDELEHEIEPEHGTDSPACTLWSMWYNAGL